MKLIDLESVIKQTASVIIQSDEIINLWKKKKTTKKTSKFN